MLRAFLLPLVFVISCIGGCATMQLYNGAKQPATAVIMVNGMSNWDISAGEMAVKVCKFDGKPLSSCQPYIEFLPGTHTLTIELTKFGIRVGDDIDVTRDFVAGDRYVLAVEFGDGTQKPVMDYTGNVNDKDSQARGKNFDGLVPAPMSLQGSIDNNVYTSKGDTFTVAVPFLQGSNDYTYMHVNEQYEDNFTYVSFGPAGVDKNLYYRVNLTPRMVPGSMEPSLFEMGPQIIEMVEQKAQKGYYGKVSVTSSDKTQVNGRQALHWLLKQSAPADWLVNNKAVTLVHDVYAIDFGYAIAIVWVQMESGVPLQGMTPAQFAASLTLLPVVNDATRRVAADGSYRFPKHPVTAVSPAVLCDLQGLTVYESNTSVDFVPPDYLWQLGGDYAVQAFPRPNDITDKQKFMADSQKYFSGYVPGDRKRLGVEPKLIGVKEMEVNGLPAMQAIGVDEGKAVLVATSVLNKSIVTVVSVLYPIHSGDDPMKVFPWACYDKFVNSVREQD